jgi:hypothetical protein
VASFVVGGALANKAGNGGEAWVRLSWIRGLAQLGLDVRFVEELAPHLAEGYDDPRSAPAVAWFRDVVHDFGLTDRATLLLGDEALEGPPLDDLAGFADDAVLVDISGHVASPRLFPRFRRRVLVDLDPGYTQAWHAEGLAGARVEGHELLFTVGESVGTSLSRVPTAGREWRHVRQPVVLADWPVVPLPGHRRFTTVASWRGGYGTVVVDGRAYGPKAHAFREVIDLPRAVDEVCELALDIHPGDDRDLTALRASGWQVVRPESVAGSPKAFRSYVQGSAAELSVAQPVYSGAATGWFSDRTVRYLATGRPAVVQETGFSRHLPTGAGLLAFRTPDEATAAVSAVASDWEGHAAAARDVAERCFAAEAVLPPFVDEVLRGL